MNKMSLLAQYKGIPIDHLLITLFEKTCIKLGVTFDEIIVTSGGRTPAEHAEVYKELERKGLLKGQKWYETISWYSNHLPTWFHACLASDIKIIKERNQYGIAISYFTGTEIKDAAISAASEMNIYICVRAGLLWAHIDTKRGRTSNKIRSYDY